MIKFTTTKQEHNLIQLIAERATPIYQRLREDRPLWTLIMDLSACHSNGCPLHLSRLLDANELDFVHDIVGIHRHINRKTGQLEGAFLPRFAVT